VHVLCHISAGHDASLFARFYAGNQKPKAVKTEDLDITCLRNDVFALLPWLQHYCAVLDRSGYGELSAFESKL
jgi:hypothetical protein